MKKLIILSGFCLFCIPLFSQCDWTTVFLDDFEHDNIDPGYIQGTAYTNGSPSFSGAKNGQKGLYLNFIDNIAVGTTVYDRSFEVCAGFTYKLSAWVCSRWGTPKCDVDIDVIDGNGTVFFHYSGLLPYANEGWMQFNTNEFIATESSIRLVIKSNESNGSSGNDFAMDDILLEGCNREIEQNFAICSNDTSNINLFDSLSTNNINGIWSDNLLGGGYLGVYNTGLNDEDSYSYLIQNGVCPDSTQIVDITYKNIIADLGNDTSFCEGQSIKLFANLGMDSYLWQDSSTSNYLQIDSAGEYSVSVTKDGCSDTDTISIQEIQPPYVNLGSDTVGCPGIDLRLSPTTNATGFKWQDGSTESSLKVNKSGQYYVKVSINQCVNSDTVNVTYLRPLTLGNDTTICEGDYFTLNIDTTYEDYSWSDGDKKDYKDIHYDGEYFLTVKKLGCTIDSDTLTVKRTLLPRILEPMIDSLICENFPLVLKAYADRNEGIVWHDFHTDTFTIVRTGGVYWAKAYNECGEAIDSVKISSEDCECNDYIPNIFTPNKDGLNDYFGFQSNCIPSKYYNLKIYSRWGDLLFDSYDYKEKWDGTHKGRVCPTGVYSYIIQLQYKHDRGKRTISRRIKITH